MEQKFILLIEDDQTITLGITTFLERQGFHVENIGTLKEADAYMDNENRIDIILLDLNLPDGTSYDLCKKIKERTDIPVIFITVCDEEKQVIKGLDLGADDYITKPFSLNILYSRIKAVLRRVLIKDQGSRLACGVIEVNVDKNIVYKMGQQINLSINEYKLLEILLRNKNCTLSRACLLEKMWDYEGNFVNDNTLTVTMKRLREKLGNPDCIKTIRGIGYLMEDTHV